MINNNTLIQLGKFLAQETPSPPGYLELGDGTTPATREDTALESPVVRKAATLNYDNQVLYAEINMNSVADAAYVGTVFSELGWFDDASSGILYDREAFGGLTFDSNTNLRITRFACINNDSNSTKSIFTEAGIDGIANWLQGLSYDEPEYMAYSTLEYLDQCDSATGWSANADGTSPSIDTTNFKEGQGSLEIGKSGTSTNSSFYTKTITSIDGTTYTLLRYYVNIDDSDTLAKIEKVRIYFGNDSSNFKYYDTLVANLNVGWQLIEITITDMNETGTVVDTSIDWLRFVVYTNTTSDVFDSGKVKFDFPAFKKSLDSDDTDVVNEQFREEVSPNPPERNLSAVKFKSQMGKTEGNYYKYYYTALFNANSGGDMFYVSEGFGLDKNDTTSIQKEHTITFKIGGQ